MFVDTHCHLTYPPLSSNVATIIKRAEAVGVNLIICVGTDLESSQAAIVLAERFEQVYAAVGIHPNDAVGIVESWQSVLTNMLTHPKVIAVGEIGLDYYWKNTPREVQLDLFRQQIQIAQESQLPMIIHNRQADNDLQAILDESGYYHGVLHCFSSTAEFASAMLGRGLFISFTGSVTYRSKGTQAAVQTVLLNRLLLETDAPFLTPVERKPQANEPAFLPLIAEVIAEWQNLDVQTVADQTTQNAIALFRLPK